MSDINSVIIEPLKQFYKESAYLVQRCTKPDRKGAYMHELLIPTCLLLFIFRHWLTLFPNLLNVNWNYKLSASRIYTHCTCYGCWISHNGFHRILRETHSHSYQQYHRWRDVMATIFAGSLLMSFSRKWVIHAFFGCCFSHGRSVASMGLASTRKPSRLMTRQTPQMAYEVIDSISSLDSS